MKKTISLENKNILVTGSAGFIGYHLTKSLLEKGYNVIGLDNLNDYYDVSLKELRLDLLKKYPNFKFIKGDIKDKELLDILFKEIKPSVVVNLAAQAGVRNSITNPDEYINTNIVGFYNILEACRNHPVEHLVYASSSSVYGESDKEILSTEDRVDKPVSLYAATKKCDEVLAYSYSKLYDIPTTGLRFFTVYGPLGRPDMAYYDFTKKLINNEKIKLFNNGQCIRDFTYIDDVVEGIIKVIEKAPIKEENPPYSIYNIGKSKPEKVNRFTITLINELIKNNLISEDIDLNDFIELQPMQKGDVVITCADTSTLEQDFNYKPTTDLKEGISKFIQWVKENPNFIQYQKKKSNTN